METEAGYDTDSGRASKRSRLSLDDSPPSRSSSSSYRPYRSLFDANPSLTVSLGPSRPTVIHKEEPWRKPLGARWMGLDSEYGVLWGENEDDGEWEIKGDIIEKMYAGYASLGDWQGQMQKWRSGADKQEEHAVEEVAVLNEGEGQAAVVLDVVPGSEPECRDDSRNNQRCWNCQRLGHDLSSCPEARNHSVINLARTLYFAEKEAPPSSHLSLWDAYIFDEDERTRRLALSRRFAPGSVSDELLDAVYDISADQIAEELVHRGITDSEDAEVYEGYRQDEINAQRQLGKHQWLLRIAHWGYPPGWLAAKDPQVLIQARLAAMPTTSAIIHDSDEDDDLEIYGDDSLCLDPAQIPSPLPDLNGAVQDINTTADAPAAEPAPPPDPPPEQPPTPPPPAAMPPSPPPIRPPSPLPTFRLDDHRPIPLGPRKASEAPQNPYLARTRPNGTRDCQPATRWARYATDLFDSDRLRPFSTARPLPLGF